MVKTLFGKFLITRINSGANPIDCVRIAPFFKMVINDASSSNFAL